MFVTGDMKLHAPQTAVAHNRETSSLSEGKYICPRHPVKDGNPSPAQMCCNHTSTVNLGGRKLKQQRGSAYLWNSFISEHAIALLCKTPLLCAGNVSEVNRYWPLKCQPSFSVWTLAVTQCGNASSKARGSDSVLFSSFQIVLPSPFCF